MQLQARHILIRLDTKLKWTWLKTRLWRIDLHYLQWHALHKGPKSHNFHKLQFSWTYCTSIHPSKPVFIPVKNWGCFSIPSFSWLVELCGRHNIGGLDLYTASISAYEYICGRNKGSHSIEWRATFVAFKSACFWVESKEKNLTLNRQSNGTFI